MPSKTGIARPLGNPFQHEHLPLIKDGAGYGEWDPEDTWTGEQPETTGLCGEQPGVFHGIVDLAEPPANVFRKYSKESLIEPPPAGRMVRGSAGGWGSPLRALDRRGAMSAGVICSS